MIHHLVFGRKYGVDFGTFIYSEIDGISGFLPVTQNGTVTFTTDRKGGNTAVQFGNGYLQTVNNLPTSNVWSFSFWMKTSQTTNACLALIGDYSQDGNIMLLINNAAANKLQVNIKTSGGTGNNVKYANNTIINDNTWKHVVIVLNTALDASNEISIYINSIKQTLTTQGTHDSDKTTPFSNLPIKFSYNIGYGVGHYTGLFDDIKIYNRPLTQTEITNLYNE